jgi:hypothetical protein
VGVNRYPDPTVQRTLDGSPLFAIPQGLPRYRRDNYRLQLARHLARDWRDTDKYIAAADFKANCLRLMDAVRFSVVQSSSQKRGKTIAKLVSLKEESTAIGEAVSAPGSSIEPLLPPIAVAACAFPEAFYRDPADRLIVATTRVANAILMARDQRILDYAARGHLTAIAA